MTCTWKLAWRNPYGTADIFGDCTVEEDHENHVGAMRLGDEVQQTELGWASTDRRAFQGDFPGWCDLTESCVLPKGHRPDCAT